MDITVQLKDAVARGASDIFIVAGRPLVYKLNGQLTNVDEARLLPPDTEEFVRQIYKLAKDRPMDRLMETGDDDFSFAVQGISRFRVSAYKQRSSLAAVVRVITFELPDPAALHIPEQVLRLADRTKGMVLVTGSAGSGKSTTLACMIDRINCTRADHIITLEDPLEYLHSHKRASSASGRPAATPRAISPPCAGRCARART